MLLALSQIGAGTLLLYFGGEWLVRGAAGLALRVGMSPFVVGMTVVAFATSSPELAVSLEAALEGVDDVAVGNVVGSNIANIALILGLSAVIRPVAVEARLIIFDMPLLLLMSVGLLLLLLDAELSRLEGALLLVGLLVFVWFNLRVGREEQDTVLSDFSEAGLAPAGGNGMARHVGFMLLGFGALVAGAMVFITGAVDIARIFGISRAVIALTVVAIGTSLPELATSVVAAARGRSDICAGNVVGSNFFNVLGILGLTALVKPLERGDVTTSDLAVMCAVAALLLPLARTGGRVSRGEGVFLLACYLAYLAWLVAGLAAPVNPAPG